MDIQKIYDYIDKNGVPIELVWALSVESEDNRKSSYKKIRTGRTIIPKLPFKLSINEQEDLVIKYIYDLTNIRINSLEELNNLNSLNNLPFILKLNEHDYAKTKYCVAFKNIPGSIIIRNKHDITSLGNIESIDGDLGFSNSQIKHLGKLKIVKGNIWVAQSGVKYFTLIEDLSPLEIIEGDLNFKKSPIKTLGTLREIKGNLNLRETNLESLGSLKFVGGNVLLAKKLKHFDFSKIKVDGTIRYFS